MWRHDRDAVSLMSGLLLVLVAGLFLLQDLTPLEFQLRWVAPVVLIMVGAAGLLASLRQRSGDRADEDPSPGTPTP